MLSYPLASKHGMLENSYQACGDFPPAMLVCHSTPVKLGIWDSPDRDKPEELSEDGICRQNFPE